MSQLCPVVVWARAAGADATDRHHDQPAEEGLGGWAPGHEAPAEGGRGRAADFQEPYETEGPGGEVEDSYYSHLTDATQFALSVNVDFHNNADEFRSLMHSYSELGG